VHASLRDATLYERLMRGDTARGLCRCVPPGSANGPPFGDMRTTGSDIRPPR
jgi:hypothetical protein